MKSSIKRTTLATGVTTFFVGISIITVFVLLLFSGDINTNVIILNSALIFIFVSSLLALLSTKIVQEVNNLLGALRSFEQGNRNARAEINTDDEFGEMAKVFNDLADDIRFKLYYLDNIPNPIMVMHKDFTVGYINKTASEKLLGKKTEECIGKKCYELINTPQCKTSECKVKQAMLANSNKKGETELECNGKHYDIINNAAPVHDNDGKVVGGMEFIIDISEIKETQRYLGRTSHALLLEMEKFAQGDLTVGVKVEKDDEIGRMFRGFNQAVSNIREMIGRVSEAVQATASASNQISASVEEMAAGAQEQNSQASEVASAVEQTTTSIFNNAKNANSASNMAKEAGIKAEEGVTIISSAKEAMFEIKNTAAETSKLISTLNIQTEQIGKITNVIDEIADQTNLLALNAAIEAARAGEHGRGFAVVADEVRKLAERTTTATKEIGDTIKEIQGEVVNVNKSMSKAEDAVNNGITLNEKVGQSFNEIYENSKKSVEIITSVAEASEEQSTASEQISKSMEGITSVSDQSAVVAQQIARAAEDLSRLTENLNGLVENFTIENHSLLQDKIDRKALVENYN